MPGTPKGKIPTVELSCSEGRYVSVSSGNTGRWVPKESCAVLCPERWAPKVPSPVRIAGFLEEKALEPRLSLEEKSAHRDRAAKTIRSTDHRRKRLLPVVDLGSDCGTSLGLTNSVVTRVRVRHGTFNNFKVLFSLKYSIHTEKDTNNY